MKKIYDLIKKRWQTKLDPDTGILILGVFISFLISVITILKTYSHVDLLTILKFFLFLVFSLAFIHESTKLSHNYGKALLIYFLLISAAPLVPLGDFLLVTLFVCMLYFNQRLKWPINFELNLTTIVSLLICGLYFSTVIFSAISLNYGDFFIHQKINNFSARKDTVFHIAIAEMIKNYQTPSTGLHGLVELKYHVYSHYLYGSIAKLLGLSVADVYGAGTWILFSPLLIVSALSTGLVWSRPKTLGGLLCLCIVLLGILHYFIGDSLTLIFPKANFVSWWAHFISESYLVSLVLLMGFLNFCMRTERINFSTAFISITYLALLTLAKVSVGFMALIVVITMVTISWLGTWAQRALLNALLLIFWCGTYFLFTKHGNPSEPLKFSWLYHFKEYGQGQPFTAFFFHHFIHFWVCFPWILYSIFKNQMSRPQLAYSISFAAATCAGFFALQFSGMASSEYYFSNVSMFLATPVIFLMCDSIQNSDKIKGGFSRFYPTVILLVSILFIFSTGLISLKPRYRTIHNVFLSVAESDESPYIAHLRSLRARADRNYLIHIPKSEGGFWRGSNECSKQPFFIAAVSGRPALLGWPLKDCEIRFYGYADYYDLIEKIKDEPESTDQLCLLTKERGFQGYFQITVESVQKITCH